MSRDRSDKEKNIDDVLLSIDSLLDTATDIELENTNEIKDDSQPKLEPSKKVTKTTATAKKSIKPSSRNKTTVRARQNKTAQAGKTSTGSNLSVSSKKTEDVEAVSAEETVQRVNPTPETVIAKTNASDTKTKLSLSEDESVLETKHSAADNNDKPETTNQIESSEDNSNSLVFTTVDDDISDVMRELPVLDDIVTAEDLALIGSGKEPPKKILTEAFKKLSLTDKIIEILENQLSDYDISKLEYKYLHELIDELLVEEKNKE